MNLALGPQYGLRLLGNFPVSQVAGWRCTLLAGHLFISFAGSEEQLHFSQQSPKMLKIASETVIYVHNVSPTNHLFNEFFHLFRPVVFPAIGITQDFHFLKSTFPSFAPEFLNGRGPIGGILWVNHKWRTKGYTAQCLSKTRVVTDNHRKTSWKSLESCQPTGAPNGKFREKDLKTAKKHE